MSLFRTRTISEMTLSLARYLPGGKLFRSKFDSNRGIYKFLKGLSEEASRCNDLLVEYNKQYYPDTTEDFITEWERALGIPDSCFFIEGLTLQERQRNVLVKLARMSVQTNEDFQALATVFGVSAIIYGGKDPAVSPPITPDKTARFTIVVEFIPPNVFPYTFPVLFGSDAISLLECLFQEIRPANCQVIFQSV